MLERLAQADTCGAPLPRSATSSVRGIDNMTAPGGPMYVCMLSLLLWASPFALAAEDTGDTADAGEGLVELSGEPGGCGCASGDLAAPLVAVLLGCGALRRRSESAR